MRMQFRRDDCGVRITAGDQRSLPSWSGTAIENGFSAPNQQRHKLRGFILNRDPTLPVGVGSRYLA